jgi:hypothetical protein
MHTVQEGGIKTWNIPEQSPLWGNCSKITVTRTKWYDSISNNFHFVSRKIHSKQERIKLTDFKGDW